MNRILAFLVIVTFLCAEKTSGQEQEFVQEKQFTWNGDRSPLYVVPIGHMWKVPVHSKTIDGFVRITRVDGEEVLTDMRYNGRDYSASGTVVFDESKRIKVDFIQLYSGQSVQFRSTGSYGKISSIEYRVSPSEYRFPIYDYQYVYLDPELRPPLHKKDVVRLVLQGTGAQDMCGYDEGREYNIFIDKHEVTIITEGCYEKTFKVKSCVYDTIMMMQSFELWNGYRVSHVLYISFKPELNSYTAFLFGKEPDDRSFEFMPEIELMKTMLEIP